LEQAAVAAAATATENEANEEAKSYQTYHQQCKNEKKFVAALNGVTCECRDIGSWSNATTTTKQNNKNEANDDTKRNSKPANFRKITRK
jgi:hypothetical protein